MLGTYSLLAAALTLSACVEDGDVDVGSDQQFDGLSEQELELAGADELALGDYGPEVAAVYAYLRRYGYFPNPELAAHYPGWTPVIETAPEDPRAFDIELEEALAMYQYAQGLPVTGRLDHATRALMAQPRCGFPDYHANLPLAATGHANGAALGLRSPPNLAEHPAHAHAGADALAPPEAPQPYQPSGWTWPITEFKYGYFQYTADAATSFQRAAMVAAMNTWSQFAPLAWAERSNPDVWIGFVPRAHGDGNDFSSNTYAHAYYPYSCSSFECVSWAGDVHFNDEDYTWGVGNGGSVQDIETIALHEFGHTLGLNHSADPAAVMYATNPLGVIQRNLHPDDIAGIQALYPTYLDRRTFDPWWYLTLNSDLVAAYGWNYNAVSFHWRDFGRGEGRVASPVFDAKYYLGIHPDLTTAFGANNYAAATWHWRENGLAEGRRSSPAFDAAYYLAAHGDLQAAYGSSNYAAALEHWMLHGLGEGRRASADFDPAYYLQANPDVAAVYGANNYAGGLSHWLLFGRAEGRTAVP